MADQVEQLTQEELENIFSHSDSFIAKYPDELRGKLEAIHQYSILLQSMGDERSKSKAIAMLKHFLVPPAYHEVVTEDQLKSITSTRINQYTVDVKPHVRAMFPGLINERNGDLEKIMLAANEQIKASRDGLNEVYSPGERHIPNVEKVYNKAMLDPQLAKGETLTQKLAEDKQHLKSLQDEELDLMIDIYSLASLKERNDDQEKALRTRLIKFHENKKDEKLATLEEGTLEYEKAKEDAEVIKYLISTTQGEEAEKLYGVARKTIYLNVLEKTDNMGSKYNGKAIYSIATSAFENLTVEDTKGEQVPNYDEMIPVTVELAVQNTTLKGDLKKAA
jgi:hypothetical protein